MATTDSSRTSISPFRPRTPGAAPPRLPDVPTSPLSVPRGLLETLETGHFQVHALLVLHARALSEE